MNSITLIGRTTKEPDVRTIPSGSKCASFCLAVDRRTKEGKTADFIDCVAWGKTAELVESYIKKGERLGIVGALQTRNYEDKEGNKRKVYEVLIDRIEFLGGNKAETTEPAQPSAPAEPETPVAPAETDAPGSLPFEI